LAHQLVLVPRFVVGLVARFVHDELLVVERNSTLLFSDWVEHADRQLWSGQVDISNHHKKWNADAHATLGSGS
jgi:hypothetical protein